MIGAIVFFTGILVRGVMKADNEHKVKKRRSANGLKSMTLDTILEDDSLPRPGFGSKNKRIGSSVPHSRSSSGLNSPETQPAHRSNGFSGGIVKL